MVNKWPLPPPSPVGRELEGEKYIMNMLNYKSYITNGAMCIVLCTLFVACSGDDLEQYGQRADNADEIGFLLKTENVTRSVTQRYSPDNPHPETMGTFGYLDLNETNMKKDKYIIFKNEEVTYSDGEWKYDPVKFWPEYSAFTSFDFFGYMPYNSSATFTGVGNLYTLSFGATLDDAMMLEGKNAPLICNSPHHKDAPRDIVRFDMDQTLTSFQLKFKLGTEMSKVREFEITKVKVSGKFPYKGTITRTYTFDEENKVWGPDPSIVWKNVVKMTSEKTLDIKNEGGSLTLQDDEFHNWGSPFYAIPVTDFNPTISVTYNVKVADNGTVTRENVTNKIIFNEDNFANLRKWALAPGKLNTLEIAIVPDHLYILADQDQYFGYLVME